MTTSCTNMLVHIEFWHSVTGTEHGCGHVLQCPQLSRMKWKKKNTSECESSVHCALHNEVDMGTNYNVLRQNVL